MWQPCGSIGATSNIEMLSGRSAPVARGKPCGGMTRLDCGKRGRDGGDKSLPWGKRDGVERRVEGYGVVVFRSFMVVWLKRKGNREKIGVELKSDKFFFS